MGLTLERGSQYFELNLSNGMFVEKYIFRKIKNHFHYIKIVQSCINRSVGVN